MQDWYGGATPTNDDATKVRSVEDICPRKTFVRQHGYSNLGHKQPNSLKNSELQACRVWGSVKHVYIVHVLAHDKNIHVVKQMFYGGICPQLISLLLHHHLLGMPHRTNHAFFNNIKWGGGRVKPM